MKTQIFNIQILMKNIIFILLFCTGMVQAQIINIPDANFKAKLLSASPNNFIASTEIPVFNPTNQQWSVSNYHSIDTNGDSEIQISEAILIKYLNVGYYSIVSLSGIETFSNLQYLSCSQNLLTSLNVQGLTNLESLDCGSNQIPSLNVQGLNNLQTLYCSQNLLTSLNVQGLSNLQYLNSTSNQLTSINVQGLTNLQTLYCDINQLTTLNIQGLTNLQYLDCDHNQIPSLNLQGLNSLKTLKCCYNQLTSLNVQSLTNLIRLDCYNNQLTSLNLQGLNNLNFFDCDFNQFTSLNVQGLNNLLEFRCKNNLLSTLNLNNLINLQSLQCDNNQLTSLNLQGMNNLVHLVCDFNLLSTLNLGESINLQILKCTNNLLTQLNIKNGIIESILEFSNNPNLQYICCDDSQLASVQQQVNAQGLSTTCNVNTYCSFEPGGNHNTITGATQYDNNTNGCDTTDPVFQHVKYNINDGTEQGNTFSNNTGTYNFYTQTGTFTVTPQFENPTYFNATPINAVQTFTDNNNNVATHNFCITPNGIKNDVEVVLSPTIPARPGFDAHYRLVFKNKGNQPLSGTIVLNFDDTRLDFVSATQTPNNQTTGQLTFNYNNLLPFENRAIDIILNVNSPQETPAVNIGDVLPFTTIINPVTGDEIPADNTFALNQIVVGAYDPNDITCLQGETVDPAFIGQFLHYQIRFENTGNFPAENVVVAYFVNTNEYDINTLQILNTSHNQLYTRITGNKIEFIFENIQLAPSAGGGGHGTIIIKMKTKNNLVLGDAVAKQANIYFDYNFPIETNEAETTFATLSIGDTLQPNEVSIYPNPALDILNIKTKTLIKKVELFDNQGRLLQTHFHNSLETSIELNKYDTGIYFVKVYTENGVGTQKVVKE